MANAPTQVKPAETQTARPPAPWRSLRDEIDTLFDRFMRNVTPWSMPSFGTELPPFGKALSGTALPSVDVVENEGNFIVTAELPGLTAENVDVTLDGTMLTIKGEKKSEAKSDEKNVHLSERSYGAFQRSFFLPDSVDRNAIAADVKNGVLTVTLPKTETAQTKTQKIEVKAS